MSILSVNQEKLEKDLSQFFSGPKKLLRSIEVAPFPARPKRVLFWNATTLIEAPPPNGFNSSAMAWGGSGADRSLNSARTKSIVEAIERWALKVYGLDKSGDYGFDLDSSSTGLAAFPYSAKRARAEAYKEAFERFALSMINLKPSKIVNARFSFSDRIIFLPTLVKHADSLFPKEKIDFYEISVPKGFFKVIICRWTLVNGKIVVGFGCEKSKSKAKLKSFVEAMRHRIVLSKLVNQNKSFDRMQQTFLFWGKTAEGDQIKEWFSQRLKAKNILLPPAKLSIDVEIPGPWNPKIVLWRCYFEGTLPMHECPIDYLYY